MVYVIAVIDTSGVVRKAWVEQGIFAPGVGIEDAAVEAVRATRFKPAQYQGKPVSAQIGISVLFKLQG
ncbi:MAG: energy transducer TonB [candidate division KSB1 bacterium]|nr:energy transducer TonB [candidate division KSB1 bacterium]